VKARPRQLESLRRQRHQRLPWGVLKARARSPTIYTKDTANANNGALSLPRAKRHLPGAQRRGVYSGEIAGTTPALPGLVS
jgi:hypothetical protein